MRVKLHGFRTAWILLAAAATLARATPAFAEPDEDEWMNLFSYQLARDLPGVLEKMGPQKKICPEVIPHASKDPPGSTDVDGVKVYSCEFEPEGDPPNDPPKKTAFRRKWELEINEKNDNPMFNPALGTYYLITKKDGKYTGNDLGYTHGMSLKAKADLTAKSQLGVTMDSDLYTRLTQTTSGESSVFSSEPVLYRGPDGAVYASSTRSTGVSHKTIAPEQRDGVDVNYLDVTRVKGQYTTDAFRKLNDRMKNVDRMWISATAGFERRRTGKDEKDDAAFGVWRQKGWHQGLGLVKYNYRPSRGQAEKTSSTSTTTTDSYGLPYTETEESVTELGFDPADDLNDLNRWSALLGLSAGAQAKTWNGRCTLTVEAGGLISSEGTKQLIGPNSNLYVSAGARAVIRKSRKTGKPRITANTGTIIYYYPKAWKPGDRSMAGDGHLEVEYNLGVNRAKNWVTPFVRYEMPWGRQAFSSMADQGKADGITTFGLRVKLNQGTRRR